MKQRFIIIRIIFLGVFFLFSLALQAQTFKASHLQRAYEKLHLNTSSTNRSDLTIRTSDDGTIEHIGIPLFNDEMRKLLPSPIYDYLEFALLDHKYHITENTLQQQKIRFFNGSWTDLEMIKPSYNCTIDNRDDKWYVIKWSYNSKEILSVAVPIDYELLANSSRREMEQNFCQGLKQYKPGKPQPLIVESDELESLHRDGLLIKKGDSFLMPEINNDIYFRYEIKNKMKRN